MLPISVHSNRTDVTLEGGFVRNAEDRRGPLVSPLQSWGAQAAKKLRRIAAAALLPFLSVVCVLACASTAAAQTAPDQVVAAALGPAAVQISFYACESSEYPDCNEPFTIYRNPPGFSQSPIVSNLPLGYGFYVGSSKTAWTDSTVKAGQTYTYEVCSGAKPNSEGNNCTTTSAVKVPTGTPSLKPWVVLSGSPGTIDYGQKATLTWNSGNAYKLELHGTGDMGQVQTPSGSIQVNPFATQTFTIIATGPGDTGTASAQFTINVICPNPPPQNVTATGGPAGIELKWANPTTTAQLCPVPEQVLPYRAENSALQQLAVLTKPAHNSTLPTSYLDSGPLQPHWGYMYEVCEGNAPNWINPYNCAGPPVAVSWGADPVLTATRLNGTTMQLRLAIDQNTVTSIMVTRQASDDPCRQGQQLGNGLQGCPDNPVTLAQSIPTIYKWDFSQQSQVPPGFDHPQTPPYVINIPNDTVKPGVEYYYQAAVVWAGTVGQNSAIVTVPSFYGTLSRQQSLAGGVTSIKQGSGAPPPPSQSGTAAVAVAAPMTRAVAPTASAAPPAQSVTAARPMMAPMATQTAPMLQPGQPMMSSTPSAAARSLAPPSAATSPAVASGSAPTSRMISSAKRVEVLPGAANLASAIKEVQQRPHDAQALYALGKAYCASKLKNAGVSDMYMALQLAEQAHNTALATQIKSSLAAQGVSVK